MYFLFDRDLLLEEREENHLFHRQFSTPPNVHTRTHPVPVVPEEVEECATTSTPPTCWSVECERSREIREILCNRSLSRSLFLSFSGKFVFPLNKRKTNIFTGLLRRPGLAFLSGIRSCCSGIRGKHGNRTQQGAVQRMHDVCRWAPSATHAVGSLGPETHIIYVYHEPSTPISWWESSRFRCFVGISFGNPFEDGTEALKTTADVCLIYRLTYFKHRQKEAKTIG